MDNTTPNESSEENQSEIQGSTSRWIGLLAIVLFFVFNGLSVCPWYMWIVFALLALITLGGIYKWGQAFFGIILLIWGSTLFGGNESSTNATYYEASTSEKSDVKLSDKERKEIEREIQEIESLHAKYQDAERRGSDEEARRLSERAWNKYQEIQKKNLTREQRIKLSNLFAL